MEGHGWSRRDQGIEFRVLGLKSWTKDQGRGVSFAGLKFCGWGPWLTGVVSGSAPALKSRPNPPLSPHPLPLSPNSEPKFHSLKS
mmetsp:Transcript_25704/g.40273  ORF Transcript_25704/g.40273 Transcript_25704/m.40273 type:complete len:85 (+) Transcript_25704:11-265(+)